MLGCFLSKPSVMLCFVWFVTFILYYNLPIEFLHPVTPDVWLLILLGLLIFIFGEKCSDLFFRQKKTSSNVSNKWLNQVVLISSVFGLFGILSLSYDKIMLSGLDYSKSLTYIREIRGIQISEGVDVYRSIWLYLGYVFFSFSYPAFILLVIHASEIRPFIARIAQLSAFSPVIYALLYGGRMPVFILILLLIFSCFVRKLGGKAFFPKEHHVMFNLFVFVICFMIYSNHILSERMGEIFVKKQSHLLQKSNHPVMFYNEFIDHIKKNWEIIPSRRLTTFIDNKTINKKTAVALITHSMYITNGLISLTKIIKNHTEFKSYMGVYQIGILSPLLRVFHKNSILTAEMKSSMMAAKIYGFYSTAWGAIFLDFGIVGSILFIAAWGFVSGIVTKKAQNYSNMGSQLIMTFCYTSFVMSIFNGPFGMSNSFLVFVALIVVAFMLKLESLNILPYFIVNIKFFARINGR